ncbi:MerR family transcriptional regulator [Marinomonas sp. S3726]|nr:MerR family transcriptional regulator [Marinomonas sp. S3726]
MKINKNLTISEVSEFSGVAGSALRFYEKKGLIHSTRTSGNQRRYHSSMLRRIALIQVAQSVGFTLEEIILELESLPMNKTPTKRDWERVAKKWQADLEDKMKRMQFLKDNLAGCVGCGCLSMKQCQLLKPNDFVQKQGIWHPKVNQ